MNHAPFFARFAAIFFLAVFVGPIVNPVAAQLTNAADAEWSAANGSHLPRWRGFNLLEKFNIGHQEAFHEEDFRLISQLGFNFVRLPMDYRIWIKNGDWEQIDDKALVDIDQAIAFGQQYHIHVCLNFHRAPGYTVAKPKEKADLWTDPDAQRVCAMHWAYFARRYKGIPSSRLSFDLLNEPSKPDRAAFVSVIGKLVAAIRAEDPDRLIISDGLTWGTEPVPELADLHIAQATRGYSPMEISHYKASWVNSEGFPPPAWPAWGSVGGTIKGPRKGDADRVLTITGPFTSATTLRLVVHKVSSSADLLVQADGKPIFTKTFQCGPGEGEWKKAVFMEQYKVYQNTYDRDYTAQIPAGASKVQISVTKGDWLELGEIGLKAADATAEDVIHAKPSFDKSPTSFKYAPTDPVGPFVGVERHDRKWLHDHVMGPWLDLEHSGVGVIVGEWGAFNCTPHEVMLRWAEDSLSNWKQAGWGWCMWNFRGPFGVLDSERADVKYENYEGHHLDRKLMDLLQKY